MNLDNQRLLQYSLYSLGIVVWFIIWRFMGAMIEVSSLAFGFNPPEIPAFGTLNNLSSLVALLGTVAIIEYTRRHAAANKFGVEVIIELRKVTWPNWKDVRGSTLVVLGVTFAVTLILWVFDSIYDGLIGLIFSLV